MKRLHLSILSFLMLVCLTSCEKDPDTTRIEGRVLDAQTSAPLANITVAIYSTRGEFLGSTSQTLVDKVTTDANGNYKWESNTITGSHFAEAIDTKRYRAANSTVSFYAPAKVKQDLTISSKAWVKFHFKNTMPFKNNDEICLGQDACFSGMNVDSTFHKDAGGNQYNRLSWYVTKNYVTKGFSDSVFVKGLDTLDYNINY